MQRDRSLTLQGDTGVPYGSVAKVMAAIERADVTGISVVTDNAAG